ncbi:Terminase small subunit [Enterobacter roggenkampii]|nr:Terminase small subunit [Enterobacter roggenkampii]
MEVNKKRLSEIFDVSIRTIQNWQDQGMPVARGGGKGNEVLYDSAAVIEWYSARDAAIENEKLRKEVEQLRVDSESDLVPGTIDYERHRLTRAQADAQELKNAKESAEVVETAFCTFVLSRILAATWFDNAARESDIVRRNAVTHPGFVPVSPLRVPVR